VVDNRVVSICSDCDAHGIMQLCGSRAFSGCPCYGAAGRSRGCRRTFLYTVVVCVGNHVVAICSDCDATGLIQLRGARAFSCWPCYGATGRSLVCRRTFLYTVVVEGGMCCWPLPRIRWRRFLRSWSRLHLASLDRLLSSRPCLRCSMPPPSSLRASCRRSLHKLCALAHKFADGGLENEVRPDRLFQKPSEDFLCIQQHHLELL